MDSQKISWWKVDLGEKAALAAAAAIRQGRLGLGPVVQEFEARVGSLLGGVHVVATTNGTTALMLALLEAGVGPGDEVIVPDRTWIATAHAAQLLGARIVLVDVEPQRPLLDVTRLEAAISARTKAIIPVHLNGRPVEMPAIRAIAERHGIVVIEDAAQAFFARSTEGFLGTNSRAGCFSLSVAKIITSGQGGFVVTKDAEIARRLRLARIHGTADVVHCHWEMLGGNFRYTDPQAAIALTQLDRLDERIAQVTSVYHIYEQELQGHPRITLLPANIAAGEIPLYVECMVPERENLVRYMAELGIELRPMYPDLHVAPHFHCPGTFENARRFGRECVVLPCGPDRSGAEIQRVVKALWKWS